MFRDKFAVAKLMELIKNFGVKTVVETGTWQGQGVLGFSRLIDSVYSIEIDEGFWEDVKKRLEEGGYKPLLTDLSFLPKRLQSLVHKTDEQRARIRAELEKKMSAAKDKDLAERVRIMEGLGLNREDVSVYTKDGRRIILVLGNSPQVIGEIIEELPEPILFFFDAHWAEYWPVLDELKAIRVRPNSLIVIDDFKVPGKPFGYDAYKGVCLDWNLLKEPLTSINSNYNVFFGEECSGDYRGVLYAVPGPTSGEYEWTMQKYWEVYKKLEANGLPGAMAGHIAVIERQVELHEHDFYLFLKERGITPEIYPESMYKLLIPEYLAAKGRRQMADFDVELSWGELLTLEQVIGMARKDNMMVVEVGSWKGLATSVLAKAIAPSGHIYAVDHWRGVLGSGQEPRAKSEDIYSIFRENMRKLGVWDIVRPLVMTSEEALEIFRDEVVDFVFIDADHRYEAVTKDIAGWWQKLRPGGVLCGHDCEGYYSEYSEEVRRLINSSLNVECVHDDYGNYYHPGVIRALHDAFAGSYNKTGSIWYKRKG